MSHCAEPDVFRISVGVALPGRAQLSIINIGPGSYAQVQRIIGESRAKGLAWRAIRKTAFTNKR
jgi:hypothetical protein